MTGSFPIGATVLAVVLVCVVVGVCAWVGSFRLRALLYYAVFASPLIPTAFGYPLLGTVGVMITPTRVLVTLCLLSLVVSALRGSRFRLGFPLFGAFACYLAVRLAGIVVAPDRAGATIYLLGEPGLITVALSYLAFEVIRDDRSCQTLVSVLLVTGIVVSIAGWWEIATSLEFTGNVLLPLIGMSPDEAVPVAMKAGQIPRIQGTLDHPLAVAGYMVLLLPMAFQRVILSRGAKRLHYWAVVAVLGLSLAGTLSRVAQFAVVVEACVFVHFFPRRRSVWAMIGAVTAAGLVLLAIYSRATEGPAGEASATTLLMPWYTIGVIAQRWADLGTTFLSNPTAAMIGFGYVRFDVSDASRLGAHAALYSKLDTDVLKLLGTTGLLGFLSWLGIFVAFFRHLIKHAPRPKHRWLRSPVAAIAIGIAGALITAVPGTSVFTYTQTWPVIGVCLGAVLGALETRGPLQAGLGRPIRPGPTGARWYNHNGNVAVQVEQPRRLLEPPA